MRLALAAGRLDVDQVLSELGPRRLAEWEAFERIEGGFGDRAAWERAAMLAQLYAESKRNPKKRRQPFKVREFLPYVEQPAPQPGKALRAQLGHLVKPKPRR